MRSACAHPPHRPCYLRASRRCCAVACAAPKAVIFDLGKVLLDFDYTKSARRLSAACQAPARTSQEVLLELFGHAPQPTGLLDRWDGRSLVEQVERGEMDSHAFFLAVAAASGLQVDSATFSELYADIFSPMPDMIAQQQLLRSRGVPTYLLSNVSGLHIDGARRRYPFLQHFDGYCLSYQVCSFKPDPEIYAAAERIAQLEGSDLVFIDDRADNVAAAAQRGWHSIHHTSTEGTLRQLAGLGLPVITL